MTEEQHSKYWLDQIVAAAQREHPDGEIIVSSGVSPSGVYHVGTLRELVTVDSIVVALRKAGRQARHLHFVDDFDILRKIPFGIDEGFKENLGMPLYLAPDPVGDCHAGYADHLVADLFETKDRLGLDMEIIRSHEQYLAGKFTDSITDALTKVEAAKKIIAEVSGRELGSDWVPVQLLSDNKRLNEWSYTGFDADKKTVGYRDKNGEEGELDYSTGRVKLDWRLDWPARWTIWQVQVEPFGRDHATKGGSFDTGKELVREIFGGEAPHPVPYDFINLAGETKKMSKSSGTGITMLQALDVMPAEILRYFIVRSRPDKLLVFDPGLGLYNLVDEFAKVEAGDKPEFEDAYKTAVAGEKKQTIAAVPFSHLVSVYQAARGDVDGTRDLLIRTGYEKVVNEQFDVLKREFEFVKNWLANYAPESVKFEVQKSLPDVHLSEDQRRFLERAAAGVQRAEKIDGEVMHQILYDAKGDLGPGQAFQAIYRVILGKDSGPKAGWFLATLEKDWLIKRLKLQG